MNQPNPKFCGDPKCICRVFADYRNSGTVSYTAIHKPKEAK